MIWQVGQRDFHSINSHHDIIILGKEVDVTMEK